MVLAIMAIHLAQAFILPHSSNCVLNRNPLLLKGTVEGMPQSPWSPACGGNDLLGTFGFTGELQDGASDLLYLRARVV